jgi:hypothetical protein
MKNKTPMRMDISPLNKHCTSALRYGSPMKVVKAPGVEDADTKDMPIEKDATGKRKETSAKAAKLKAKREMALEAGHVKKAKHLGERYDRKNARTEKQAARKEARTERKEGRKNYREARRVERKEKAIARKKSKI